MYGLQTSLAMGLLGSLGIETRTHYPTSTTILVFWVSPNFGDACVKLASALHDQALLIHNSAASGAATPNLFEGRRGAGKQRPTETCGGGAPANAQHAQYLTSPDGQVFIMGRGSVNRLWVATWIHRKKGPMT